jgi:hypothetical protein
MLDRGHYPGASSIQREAFSKEAKNRWCVSTFCGGPKSSDVHCPLGNNTASPLVKDAKGGFLSACRCCLDYPLGELDTLFEGEGISRVNYVAPVALRTVDAVRAAHPTACREIKALGKPPSDEKATL